MKVLKTEVISYFGSINETAKRLKVSRQAIHRWGEYIPELRAFQFIELCKTNKKSKSAKDTKASGVNRSSCNQQAA